MYIRQLVVVVLPSLVFNSILLHPPLNSVIWTLLVPVRPSYEQPLTLYFRSITETLVVCMIPARIITLVIPSRNPMPTIPLDLCGTGLIPEAVLQDHAMDILYFDTLDPADWMFTECRQPCCTRLWWSSFRSSLHLFHLPTSQVSADSFQLQVQQNPTSKHKYMCPFFWLLFYFGLTLNSQLFTFQWLYVCFYFLFTRVAPKNV